MNGSLGCFSWFPLSFRFICWIWYITLQTGLAEDGCSILIVNFTLSEICSLLRNPFMSHQEQLRQSEAKQKKPRYTLSLSLVCEYWIFLAVFFYEKKSSNTVQPLHNGHIGTEKSGSTLWVLDNTWKLSATNQLFFLTLVVLEANSSLSNFGFLSDPLVNM